MNILIIRTDLDDNEDSRSLDGTDNAITMNIYNLYRSMGVTANHVYDKYTYVDLSARRIYSKDSMSDLLESIFHNGSQEISITSHESWLDKVEPGWEDNPRNQYW